jgi:hypothetical protein
MLVTVTGPAVGDETFEMDLEGTGFLTTGANPSGSQRMSARIDGAGRE